MGRQNYCGLVNNQGKLFAALYCEARALRAAAVSDELALHPGMLASGQTSGRQQAATAELTEPGYLACTVAVAPQGWLPWIKCVFCFDCIPTPRRSWLHCLVLGLMLLSFSSGWIWGEKGRHL